MPFQKSTTASSMNSLASAMRSVSPSFKRNEANYAMIVEAVNKRQLSNTDVMLILWCHKDRSEAQLRDLVLSLHPRVAGPTRRGILKRLLRADHIGQDIIAAGEEVTEFEQILKAFGDQGYYGVAVHDRVVYPVEFKFEEGDDDYRWALNNENIMRVKVAQALMNQLNLKELACEVLLFGTKGFSAEYTGVHVAHQDLNRPGVTVTADGMIVE